MSKFFTYDERLEVQKYLKESFSFKEISRRINKHPTTISREIRKYSLEVASGYPGYCFNECIKRFNCKNKNICASGCTKKRSTYCKLCSSCNDNCPDFVLEVCTARYRVPYVCNGCKTLAKCTLMKNIYDAEKAHIRAHNNISEARSGLCVSEAEIERLNSIITPLVRKGHSIHQIYVNHKDELMCSEKTLYNYVDVSLFDVRNINLPRKVKFRKRYKRPEFKVDRSCRTGRTYEDFLVFMNKNPDVSVVQMDSVIGQRGGKCLLTIHFVETSLMLAFLRDANTSRSVTDIFEMLYVTLGKKLFKKLFPVILTDNGSEFSNPKAIEYNDAKYTGIRTNVFYCDAGRPYQKGSIEVNHEFIRRILPKGTSFNNLTQEDVNLMMDHINSYKRKKLNNRSPYEAFSFYHGEEALHKLGCYQVAPCDIVLKPNLLKK